MSLLTARNQIINILKDLKWTLLFSAVLMALAVYVSQNNISPPLIVFGGALPFLVTFLYRRFRKR